MLTNDKDYIFHHSKAEEDQKCVIKLLSKIERSIVQKIQFKMNLPTAVDFMLLYTYGSFGDDEALQSCTGALPWVYFIEMTYARSRDLLPSSIALAALCYVVLM